MASEDKSMNTLDDDVTFERMKTAQKKSSFYSTHRQLSWQFSREVKQYEKDRNLATFGIDREKTSMIDRLAKLQEAQKEIQSRRHSEPNVRRGRRSSEPCISVQDLKNLTSGELPKKEEKDTKPASRLSSRRNTVAEGLNESLPLLRRSSIPSSVTGTKRKGSLEERHGVIKE